MKKIIISTTLFTLAVILFSSCSNSHGISIVKRHYRSGYYVDFGGRNHTNVIAAPSTKKAISEKHTIAIAPVVIAKSESYVALKTPLVAAENPAIAAKMIVSKKIQENNRMVLTSTVADQSALTLNTRNSNDVSGSSGDGHQSRDNASVPFVVIVLCAIFIPPLGVGLMYGINSYFWIDLILTLLFFFPGMIFAIIVVLM